MTDKTPKTIPFPKTKGFFGIGIENLKSTKNIGTIWRSAQIMGASFCFSIGESYTRMKTDTLASTRQIPHFYFETLADFLKALPSESRLVGLEMTDGSIPITDFVHPKRAVYLLGSEYFGLSEEAQKACDHIVQLPGEYSLNVSVAASLIMYDRLMRKGF